MTTQFKYRGEKPSVDMLNITHSLEEELGLPRFIASVLASRGIRTKQEAEYFMNPSLERDWLNPYGIEGLSEAVDALERALREKRRIVVFGDFDVDGITATTVMTRGIRALGGIVTPFIPSRFAEGYGLTMEALERVRQLNPDVLVTVDCGISCSKEVKAAQDMGIEVVVTDHHEAGANVPQGVPVVDPKAQKDCPSAILAGVGVALKVVQALGSRMGYPHLWRSYTDFATLGTVADLMPMVEENRALVSDGLRRMNEEPRPCIAALIAAAGVQPGSLTSTNLSFSLIPRINAAGRMDSVQLALDLMMTDSYEEASLLAQSLDSLNVRRREIESELSACAKEKAAQEYGGERVLVVAGEGWHEGVKGIVASKLAGEFGVPSLLFTIEGDEARGSGRSVGAINLFKAVESARGLLTKFGGHSAAVGVTLPVANLDAFRCALDEYMHGIPEGEFHPRCDVDAPVRLEELTIGNVEKMQLLAPFGHCNPEPVLLAHNVVLEQCRAVGADKSHFSCVLSDGISQVKGILFHCDKIDELLVNDAVVDAAFSVQVDEWRGSFSVKAMLKAIAPARPCAGLSGCLDSEDTGFLEGLYCNGCESEGGCGASSPSEDDVACRAKWEALGRRDPDELKREIIRAIIGDGSLHGSQERILDMLESRRSVLGVMATGRGKSLIFQVHAAMLALTERKASLFVYPLRALMADQAFHLGRKFARFGLVCKVLNGDTSQEDRASVYEGLADGSIDIVLTTPEYLSFHAQDVARCGRIGFMVVDEAHHIGQAKAGSRPAYCELGKVVSQLGDPVVLAVTATATSEIADDIARVLPVGNKVVDESSRENLHIDDQRGIMARDDYLAHIAASGEKCVVYVNSREQSVDLARKLRAKIPQLAPMICFYNAGLNREDRSRIERLFREGTIRVLVATSAFGEGIDIPDIRHAVLYHMPFSDVEFNQMAGRAGRDGEDAWVHLLYGRQDVSINRSILSQLAPERDVMAQVYRQLCSMQRSAEGGEVELDFPTLARLASQRNHAITEAVAECGVAVFNELGLIKVRANTVANPHAFTMHVVESASKVELTDSVRYREGIDEMESFMAFRDWAMKSDLHSLTVRITHPISPGEC